MADERTYATRHLQHVCYELGTDGSTRLVLLVLPGVRKTGDYSSDTTCGSCAAGMDHDKKLHESIVDISGGSRLEDEDVFVSHGFTNGDARLLI